GSRVAPEKRAEFLVWLKKLEYEIHGMPRDDIVVYLRLKPSEAQRLVARKAASSYTTREHDLLQSDLTHLQQTALVYGTLAAESNWATVECFEALAGSLKSKEDIHRLILAAVEPIVTR